jgi:hypothetical protein
MSYAPAKENLPLTVLIEIWETTGLFTDNVHAVVRELKDKGWNKDHAYVYNRVRAERKKGRNFSVLSNERPISTKTKGATPISTTEINGRGTDLKSATQTILAAHTGVHVDEVRAMYPDGMSFIDIARAIDHANAIDDELTDPDN